jgi:hypothetical protein
MLARVRRILKAILHAIRVSARFAEASHLSVLRTEYLTLLSRPRYRQANQLNGSAYGLYSQGDEDGIIRQIFDRIGTDTRSFIEFGCGDGLENNTAALLLDGWRGLWIDGDPQLCARIRATYRDEIRDNRLTVASAFLTRENINEVISDNWEGGVDLLSVDIDGNDLHVLNAMKGLDPRLIIVEYNARKGPSIDWVMSYNPAHVWDDSDYYGASLKAFERLMERKGYSLVGCSITGINAFFVRNDLVDGERFLQPFDSETHFEPQRKLLRLGIHTAHRPRHGPWCRSSDVEGDR